LPLCTGGALFLGPDSGKNTLSSAPGIGGGLCRKSNMQVKLAQFYRQIVQKAPRSLLHHVHSTNNYYDRA
jgi:hypothetical protein